MGRYFTLALELGRNEPQPKTKSKPVKGGGINLGWWIIIGFFAMGLVYLFAVNSISTRGYEIKKLEKRLLELKEANKRLELESASLKSIQNLKATGESLNLVPSGKIRYLGERGYVYEN